MKRRAVAFGLSCLATTSLCCATVDKIKDEIGEMRQPMTAEWASTSTTVERDEYRQTLSLRGPDFEEKVDRQGVYYRAHLRGTLAKNGAENFQLYLATHLPDRVYNLSSAEDQDGIPLAVGKAARKKQCGEGKCVYYEHIAVALTREYLEGRQRRGIELAVSGPGGGIPVVVSEVYIQGFLQRLAAEQAAQAGGSSESRKAAKVSYCRAKYGTDSRALSFCQHQARASYQRLKPALDRARADSFTGEARLLESCMRRHNGRLGIDWMLVEHCYGKGMSSSRGGPASR